MRSCYIIQGAQPDTLQYSRGVEWGGGREAQARRDRCIVMADLHSCTSETITTS